MERLSYFCIWAVGDRKGAARAFITEATEKEISTVMRCSMWRDEDVLDYRKRDLTMLIEGNWGSYWLVSRESEKKLDSSAPKITPEGLIALGRGLVDIFQN